MALVWILVILIYFIFNVNILLALLLTESKGETYSKRAAVLWTMGIIMFGLPLLFIGCLTTFIISMVKIVNEEISYQKIKKMNEQRRRAAA